MRLAYGAGIAAVFAFVAYFIRKSKVIAGPRRSRKRSVADELPAPTENARRHPKRRREVTSGAESLTTVGGGRGGIMRRWSRAPNSTRRLLGGQ
jgi:hypothetical protein